MRIGLHVHTAYSDDCWVPLEAEIDARILRQAENLAAQDIARQRGMPLAARSDAHLAREIGREGIELDECCATGLQLLPLPVPYLRGTAVFRPVSPSPVL